MRVVDPLSSGGTGPRLPSGMHRLDSLPLGIRTAVAGSILDGIFINRTFKRQGQQHGFAGPYLATEACRPASSGSCSVAGQAIGDYLRSILTQNDPTDQLFDCVLQ